MTRAGSLHRTLASASLTCCESHGAEFQHVPQLVLNGFAYQPPVPGVSIEEYSDDEASAPDLMFLQKQPTHWIWIHLPNICGYSITIGMPLFSPL